MQATLHTAYRWTTTVSSGRSASEVQPLTHSRGLPCPSNDQSVQDTIVSVQQC